MAKFCMNLGIIYMNWDSNWNIGISSSSQRLSSRIPSLSSWIENDVAVIIPDATILVVSNWFVTVTPTPDVSNLGKKL